ncbi:hypothetical protein Tco_0274439 [Tanacetum coccineum]
MSLAATRLHRRCHPSTVAPSPPPIHHYLHIHPHGTIVTTTPLLHLQGCDPEEYEDDETEDGPVDYPMDGGDDGDE